MLAIVDYGVGNLFSLKSSVERTGCDACVSGNADEILKADHIILPGVGAFGDAADKLRASGLDKTVKEAAEKGTPILGICVGMQMLFQKDYEYGEHDGLGLIPGKVIHLKETVGNDIKVPAIGWSELSLKKQSRLFAGVPEGSYVYFVHSYSAVGCDEYVSAATDYGALVTAAVEKGNVFGTQFHPEKSGGIGLDILRNFCRI